MEFKAAGLIAVIGAVMLMAGSSDAVSCYVCESAISSGCSDPFTATSSKTDCTASVTSCTKSTGGVSGEIVCRESIIFALHHITSHHITSHRII